jgi:hypothetical protein
LILDNAGESTFLKNGRLFSEIENASGKVFTDCRVSQFLIKNRDQVTYATIHLKKIFGFRFRVHISINILNLSNNTFLMQVLDLSMISTKLVALIEKRESYLRGLFQYQWPETGFTSPSHVK